MYGTVEAVRGVVSFPVVTVGERNLAEDTAAVVNNRGTPGFIQIPAWTRQAGGRPSFGVRQCKDCAYRTGVQETPGRQDFEGEADCALDGNIHRRDTAG